MFTSGTWTIGEDLQNKYLENEGNRIEENLLKIENTAGCFIIWLLKVRQFRKDFLVSSDSSKKRMNKFVFSTVRPKKNEFVRSFFGRIRGYQKSFRNYLTFSHWVGQTRHFFDKLPEITDFGLLQQSQNRARFWIS